MAENSEGASGLSAEAKVFIPRQANNHGDGHMTIQQIPSYMMNCYPFVQSDFVRNRAPWFGNNRGRGYHGHQGNRKQRSFGGHHGNRMPQPHNFPGDFHMPYHPGMPPPPMDMPWNGILPMNPMMLSSRLDCNTQPSGVPFDGGTKSPDPPGMGSGGTGEKHRKQNSGKQDNSKYRKPDTNNNRGAASTGAWEVEDRRKKSRNGQRGRSEVGSKVNAWSDGKDTPRTVICKEISVQTDFPDRIANSTLQQKPSPLFVSKRHYHGNSNLDSSDSDLDSDSGYSSPLHKRNQVSNGTHPAGFIETITFTKSPPVQSESKTVEAAKSVPQPKMSYAMIAQKVPTSSSHNTCVHTENLSSSNTGCDNRSKDKNSNHDPHWSKEGKTGANKNNSSVHCDANVTNNNDGKSADEDNGIERVNAVGEKKKRKRNRKRKKKKGDGDKVEDNDVVEKEDVELHFEDEEEFPDLLGSGNKKLSREITPGSRESNQSVIEDRINLESDENLVMSTPVSYLQKQNNDYSGTPWKTHSGHQNAWNGSGRREITPNVWKNRTVVDDTSVVDVGPVIDPGYQESTPMGTVIESPGVMGTPSYSEILKTRRTVTFQDRKSEEQKINAPQKQLKKPPHKSAAHQNTSGQTDNADLSETRATRKRRKRREMMNQAAEEELAEISLEQDMLRELNLNPKSKVSKPAPKSTVKESNSPQPGILHANPSQLSGGGKKSKQLIALDLGAMIDALEKKKDVTDHDQSHVSNQPSMKKKQENQVRSKPHNILDASAPVVKRGKERENPKPKKPSPLKKVILKEREEKKQLRLLEENMPENTGAPVGIGVVSAESDLSQDAMSYKGSADYGVGTPASNDLSPISQTSSISMSPLSPGASPLSSEVNSPVAGQIGREAILKIHSRRFREYCNQVLNKDIDNSCTALLQDLVRFQDRVYHRDPTKAKIKRRIVLGLREVTKHLKLKKIKCVIISPNLEKIQSKGGLDDALNNILNLCNQQDIPFVFALGRRSLGRACAKLVPVSVVGIFSYEGTETNFRHLMELTEQARQSYKEMVSVIEKEIREYPTRGSAASAPHIYAHMGHSRTPSGASVLSFTSSILSEPISENYPHSEPETDSKGYEIVKDVEENFGQFNFSAGVVPNKTITYPTKVSYKIPHKRDIDDGNEADTEDFGEKPRVKGQCQHGLESDKDSDNDSQQGADTVEDLPHIDSIHSSTYDLSTEILSQHSGRTLESCEAMSTHSSRTLGDGSSTILADPGERSSKHDTPKSMESPSSTLQRGKVVDEERIKHWVDETQSRLENLQLQISGTEDSGSSSSESETEENSVDEVETVTCDPQVKVETVSNKNVASINSENQPDIVENVGANDAKIETNLNGSGVYETKDNCVDDVNGSCQKQNASNVSLTMISQGLNRTDPSQNNPVLGQTEVKGCQNTSNDVGERA